MKRTLLIINAASGSAAAVGEEELLDKLRACGLDVIRSVRLPEEDIPSRKTVEGDDIEVVTVLSATARLRVSAPRLPVGAERY